MDVVLTPTGSTGNAWTLDDRLGRKLGTVTKPDDTDNVLIQPEPAGLLESVKKEHASLDAAMSAIATAANGACTLDSRDWE